MDVHYCFHRLLLFNGPKWIVHDARLCACVRETSYWRSFCFPRRSSWPWDSLKLWVLWKIEHRFIDFTNGAMISNFKLIENRLWQWHEQWIWREQRLWSMVPSERGRETHLQRPYVSLGLRSFPLLTICLIYSPSNERAQWHKLTSHSAFTTTENEQMSFTQRQTYYYYLLLCLCDSWRHRGQESKVCVPLPWIAEEHRSQSLRLWNHFGLSQPAARVHLDSNPFSW